MCVHIVPSVEHVSLLPPGTVHVAPPGPSNTVLPTPPGPLNTGNGGALASYYMVLMPKHIQLHTQQKLLGIILVFASESRSICVAKLKQSEWLITVYVF